MCEHKENILCSPQQWATERAKVREWEWDEKLCCSVYAQNSQHEKSSQNVSEIIKKKILKPLLTIMISSCDSCLIIIQALLLKLKNILDMNSFWKNDNKCVAIPTPSYSLFGNTAWYSIHYVICLVWFLDILFLKKKPIWIC
jgi:hypothetical protein